MLDKLLFEDTTLCAVCLNRHICKYEQYYKDTLYNIKTDLNIEGNVQPNEALITISAKCKYFKGDDYGGHR